LVSGKISNTWGYLVKGSTAAYFKRVYVIPSENYIVILEPDENPNNYWFSSAFIPNTPYYIMRLTSGQKMIFKN
ncbi:MAG: hypothetical protein ABI857_13545, partial [Acidobacteriota bacterium]